MQYKDLILGVLMSVAASVLGSFIFIEAFTGFGFADGIAFYKAHDLLGKIITLGAILNLILFFIVLKFNKELMARGVVLGMFILTIITLII